MSTTVDEGLDTDLLGVLDFDHQIPCDVRSATGDTPDCDWPAEWRVVLSCCGRVVFHCNEHFDIILEMIGHKLFADWKRDGGCGAINIENPFSSADRI